MEKRASFFNPKGNQQADQDPLVQFVELLIKIDKREKVVNKVNETERNETEVVE